MQPPTAARAAYGGNQKARLQWRAYSPPATIAGALDKVLSTTLFSFDDRELLRAALHDYREGEADFADFVIGRRNTRSGCEHTVTFDRSLRGDSSFHML